MLELKNISVGYRGREVVCDVSLTFRPGEITTIIGKNGTGKSTLLKSACSLLSPLSGSVVLDGKGQQEYTRRQWAKKVAFLSQDHLDSNCTVHSLVSHGRHPHLGFSKKRDEQDHLLVERALETMGLNALRHKSLLRISGGERQKAYLAMALAQDTPYIALDEPATYLDLAVQREILHLLKTLKHQGKCIIAVMHDLGSALEVSDHICLLDGGKVATYATPAELLRSEAIERVFNVECTEVSGRRGPRYLFS